MHILLTGGTGFIGSALIRALRGDGHDVSVYTRQTDRRGDAGLRYVTRLDDVEGPVDAVVNLAGASLADQRWTPAYKQVLRDSRVGLTGRLGRWLAARSETPGVVVSASAIGYYGRGGATPFNEDSPAGEGFAAGLCVDWEAAAHAATPAGSRLCVARLGVVFDRDGGAYPRMAKPFRLHVGNWIGSGEQWLSWVHRRDVVAALRRLLDDPDLSGAFNITAPEATTSRGFCRAMQAQHRSIVSLPAPAAVMRLAFGEMADELLIHGQRVEPRRLCDAGFRFAYPSLEEALAQLEARAA